jgi:hypothetical protein
MAVLDGGGRRPRWRERSSCWEPEKDDFFLTLDPKIPPLFLLLSLLLGLFFFSPLLFLFLLFWPSFSDLKNKIPLSVFCLSVNPYVFFLKSFLPSLFFFLLPSLVLFGFPLSLSHSFSTFPPLSLFSSLLLLFISRRRGSSPLLYPIVVQGGAGLPYLCRVRWPPVCRHDASVSSIIMAGYGLLLMSWFSQVGGERRRG